MRLPQRRRPWIDGLVIAWIIAGLSVFAAEAERAAGSTTGGRLFAFDIPAQPLASALDVFSSLTGIETLYDSAIARNRRSAAVKGNYTATQALSMLLSGNNLSARVIAPDAVTLETVQANTSHAGPAPEKSVHRRYLGLVQAELEQAFCNDPQLRPGDYRAVLRFLVAANGRLKEARVVGTTGSGVRDQKITHALESIVIERSPPADLQQPIMMVILPQTAGTILNCAQLQ